MVPNASCAVVRFARQIVMAIAASYLGAIFGLGLYIYLHWFGFHFQEIAGDLAEPYFVGVVVLPIMSVLGCVLASSYVGDVRPSKLGILLGLVASYVGVYFELLLFHTTGRWVSLLWPAIVGICSFLGYQAGLMVVRRWLSSKRATTPGA